MPLSLCHVTCPNLAILLVYLLDQARNNDGGPIPSFVFGGKQSKPWLFTLKTKRLPGGWKQLHSFLEVCPSLELPRSYTILLKDCLPLSFLSEVLH